MRWATLLVVLQVLTKSLLPLPDKWHGLADVEQRYRKRCGRAGGCTASPGLCVLRSRALQLPSWQPL